jgi:hypothetical protein
MTKNIFAFALAFLLLSSGYVMAQQTDASSIRDPFLRQGSKELSLSGLFDFEQRGDPQLDFTGRYGFFIRDYIEVGGFVELAGNFDDIFRYGLGAFAEYHLPDWSFMTSPRVMPYIGADLGFAFVDSDISEDNAALIFQPRIGLKWFIRDFFAIDTNFFLALATDDLYQNDRNDLDPYDVGIRLGIRVYFN